MQSLIDFFGRIIATLSGKVGYSAAIVICAALSVVLLSPIQKKDRKNIELAKKMSREVETVKKKKTKKGENYDSSEALRKIFSRYGYTPYLNIRLSLLELIFAVGVGLGFSSSVVNDNQPKVNGVSLCNSPYRILSDTGDGVALTVILLFSAAMVQWVYNLIHEKTMVNNEKASDMVMMFIVLVALIFLPSAATVFILFCKLFDIAAFIMINQGAGKAQPE